MKPIEKLTTTVTTITNTGDLTTKADGVSKDERWDSSAGHLMTCP